MGQEAGQYRQEAVVVGGPGEGAVQPGGGEVVDLKQSGPPRGRGITSPAVLCNKEPARASNTRGFGTQNTPQSSMVLYGIRAIRTFPCMEVNYFNAIKNQRGASP